MPYFSRVSPAGPIAGGISLPSPPPIVGTRVALMGRVSMGSITDSIRDWVGIPSQGSIAKAASYGLLGLGFWVGGAYLPGIWWPLKIGKAGLFVGGAWLLYRAIAQVTAKVEEGNQPYDPFSDPNVSEAQKEGLLGLNPEEQERVEARYYASLDAWHEAVGQYVDALWAEINEKRGWDPPWLTVEEDTELRRILGRSQEREANEPMTGLPPGTLSNVVYLLKGSPFADSSLAT